MSEQRKSEERPRIEIPGIAIHQRLGEGGMGVVYRGRQDFVDRDVAVKLLRKNDTEGDFMRRFRREAKILANISDPHIVGCYQAGITEQGFAFMVMEFIDGPDLRRWIETNGALPPRVALQVAADLARALDSAHEQGIIHRDVKPENVLLKFNERAALDDPFPYVVKLADLGLARGTSDSTSTALTVQGAMMGTPSTMAPEQFDDPSGIDYRADIYALGCVLYHCLVGQAAYNQRTITEIFAAKTMPQGPDPRKRTKSLPAALGKYVSRVMSFDPDQRPQSYEEIVADLEGLKAKLEARPKASVAEVKEEPRTSPAQRYALMGAGGLLLVLLLALAWKALQPGAISDGPRPEAGTGASAPSGVLAATGSPASTGRSAPTGTPTPSGPTTPPPAIDPWARSRSLLRADTLARLSVV